MSRTQLARGHTALPLHSGVPHGGARPLLPVGLNHRASVGRSHRVRTPAALTRRRPSHTRRARPRRQSSPRWRPSTWPCTRGTPPRVVGWAGSLQAHGHTIRGGNGNGIGNGVGGGGRGGGGGGEARVRAVRQRKGQRKRAHTFPQLGPCAVHACSCSSAICMHTRSTSMPSTWFASSCSRDWAGVRCQSGGSEASGAARTAAGFSAPVHAVSASTTSAMATNCRLVTGIVLRS